jgi:hypothetical protein
LRTQGNGSFDRFGGRGRTANPEAGIHLKPSDVRSYPAAPRDTATLRTIFLTFEDGEGPRSLPLYRTDVMCRPHCRGQQEYADVGSTAQLSYSPFPRGSSIRSTSVRLRAPAPGHRWLPDAQPAELEQRRHFVAPCCTARLQNTIFQSPAPTTSAWSSTAKAGQYSTRSSSGFLRTGSRNPGSTVEGPGQPAGEAAWYTRRWPRRIGVSTKSDRRRCRRGRRSSICKVLNTTPADKLEAGSIPCSTSTAC